MSEHSPEPWFKDLTYIYDDNENPVGPILSSNGDYSEQDARRIVACVNACKGIETEAIEGLAEGTIEDALKVMWDDVAAARFLNSRKGDS